MGDVIVTVDGEDVGTDAGLAEMIQAYEPGDEVVLGVIAPDADGPRDVTVTLGEHPDQEGQAYLGIGYAPMTSMREFQWREMPFFNDDGEFQGELPEDFDPEEFFRGMPGMPGMRGFRALPDVELPEGVDSAAIIGAVTPGSPADDAGLATGDVVLAVNGESVDGPDALVAAVGDLAPGDEVTLTLLRSSEEVAVTVTLGENPDTPGAAYLGVMVGGFIRMERSGEPGGLFNFGDRFRDLDLPRRGGQDA